MMEHVLVASDNDYVAKVVQITDSDMHDLDAAVHKGEVINEGDFNTVLKYIIENNVNCFSPFIPFQQKLADIPNHVIGREFHYVLYVNGEPNWFSNFSISKKDTFIVYDIMWGSKTTEYTVRVFDNGVLMRAPYTYKNEKEMNQKVLELIG